MTMDSLDYRLILELQNDGRQSNADIARRVHVSEATVRRRIQRLVEEDVIKLTAIPNLDRLGFRTVVVMGFLVKLRNLLKVTQWLSAQPHIHFVSTTTGRYDVVAWGAFPSTARLTKFIREELPKAGSIEQSETLLVLNMPKMDWGWLGEEALVGGLELGTPTEGQVVPGHGAGPQRRRRLRRN